jgi:hypothetical protein
MHPIPAALQSVAYINDCGQYLGSGICQLLVWALTPLSKLESESIVVTKKQIIAKIFRIFFIGFLIKFIYDF